MRLGSTLLLLLVMSGGCFGGDNASPTSPDGIVSYADVYMSQTSGFATRHAEVISRESRWAEVWEQITATQSPKPARPAVNFEERILVVVALGETAATCHFVKVDNVQRVDGELRIAVVDAAPQVPGCACPIGSVQPVHVIAVPRLATSASFTWGVKTIPC